jgi:hypothetical protein
MREQVEERVYTRHGRRQEMGAVKCVDSMSKLTPESRSPCKYTPPGPSLMPRGKRQKAEVGRRMAEEKRRNEVGRRKKEARLTRFSISETNNHTQQSSHGTMRHDCSIVIEWVDADCSFTHMD